jgi:hypothetical protein
MKLRVIMNSRKELMIIVLIVSNKSESSHINMKLIDNYYYFN